MTFDTPLLLLLLLPILGGTIWAWRGRSHGLGRRRRGASLALRLAIFSALILALAGLTWQRPRQAQAVIFVADLSASTESSQDTLIHFIDQALHARGRDDQAGVVALGKEAEVEQPATALSSFSGFESVVDPSFTDLEGGLSLGAALLPANDRKRLVLATDGRENLGDAISEARLLQAEGVRVDVLPLVARSGPEVRVDGVDVPSSLHAGERFPVTVRITSNVATTSGLEIFEDGQVVKSTTVAVQPGSGTLSYTLTARSPGVHTYRAVIQPASDTLSQNNEGSAFASVSGAPRVLVVEGAPGYGDNVMAALRSNKIAVDRVPAYAAPQDLTSLQRYAGIVLVDAPADLLGQGAMSSLRSYVADLGRGLVVIGGPNSFGAGNYNGTPLEQALPVSMDLPKRKDLPTAAVVLIIESLESETNVDISKRAAQGVLDTLTPQDMIAVSDAGSGITIPLQHVTNRTSLKAAIANLSPADPISYQPFLQAAFDTLKNAKAQTKHIVLLGDGDAMDDYGPLVKKIARAGIQVSTIETNAAAPEEFQIMRDIARWGNGKYYAGDNVLEIPRIFVKVARTVAQSSIMQGRFYPAQYAPSQIMAGIDQVPPLEGYVVTTPKQLATVVLASPKNDPVLAQWQYGLGRAVTWTSDSQGRWSASWLADPATKRIWSAMVNWVLPPPQSSSLTLTTSVDAGQATIGVDVRDNSQYQRMSARVVGPDNAAQTVTLQPTTPSHYEAQLPVGSQGAYLVDVQAALRGSKAVRSVSGGLVLPYAPDYRDSGPDYASMQTIANAGGGSLVRSPSAAFANNAPPVDAPTPLKPWLLLLALLLLPVDVAMRRLVLGREDWQAVLAALPMQWRPDAAPGAEVPASAPLANMRRRRSARRAGMAEPRVAAVIDGTATLNEAAGEPAASLPPGVVPRDTVTPFPPSRRPEPGRLAHSAGAATGSSAPPPAASDASAASRLLEAKRKRRAH